MKIKEVQVTYEDGTKQKVTLCSQTAVAALRYHCELFNPDGTLVDVCDMADFPLEELEHGLAWEPGLNGALNGLDNT